jgi:hypothetical protein
MASYKKKDEKRKTEELLKGTDYRLCEAREQGINFMLSA